MRSRFRLPVAVGVIIAALAVTAAVGDALAGTRKPKVFVTVYPRYRVVSPYAPYYYSPWNPYSIYSIYDHLSGGRQLCHLPSEPCDNEHRVQN